MLYLTAKAALSGLIIAVVSEVARRSPTLGALIVSLPLISILGILWLWHGDITRDALPRADVILCRDCLVHFSFKDIFAAIDNFKKSQSRYLLATTFIAFSENLDVATGEWRRLNMPPNLVSSISSL